MYHVYLHISANPLFHNQVIKTVHHPQDSHITKRDGKERQREGLRQRVRENHGAEKVSVGTTVAYVRDPQWRHHGLHTAVRCMGRRFCCPHNWPPQTSAQVVYGKIYHCLWLLISETDQIYIVVDSPIEQKLSSIPVSLVVILTWSEEKNHPSKTPLFLAWQVKIRTSVIFVLFSAFTLGRFPLLSISVTVFTKAGHKLNFLLQGHI